MQKKKALQTLTLASAILPYTSVPFNPFSFQEQEHGNNSNKLA